MAGDGSDDRAAADPAICVIDVGSPANIGWGLVSAGDAAPESFDALLGALPGLVLSRGLCLGFEAPLVLPRVEDWRRFTAGRAGDGGRPWSAGAGAAVATIGLALMVHVFDKLRGALPRAEATFDPMAPARKGVLFIFEAFVSGRDKRGDHHGDALCAAEALAEMRAQGSPVSAVTVERPFNLAGAALLATGWSTDPGLLSAPCLVVRPGSAPA